MNAPPQPAPSLLPLLTALSLGGVGIGVVMVGWNVPGGVVLLAGSLGATLLLLAAMALGGGGADPGHRLGRVAGWSVLAINAQVAAALLAHLLSLRLGADSWPPAGASELPRATFFIAAILAAGAGMFAGLPVSAIRAGRSGLRAATMGLQAAIGIAAFTIATASHAWVLGTGQFGAGTHAAFPAFHALAAWKSANLLAVACLTVHALAVGMEDRSAAIARTNRVGRLWLLAAAATATITILEAVLLSPRG